MSPGHFTVILLVCFLDHHLKEYFLAQNHLFLKRDIWLLFVTLVLYTYQSYILNVCIKTPFWELFVYVVLIIAYL